MIRPDRVAAYIRWSTDDQAEGTTLQVQLEACRAYMASQGWSFGEERLFVDDGCSGGTLNRPALTRLRARVAAGEIDCVVVFKLDRLSRSVVDMVNLVLREWAGKCALKSARESIDTESPAGKMFFYTLTSFAEWERSVIRERTMAGRLRRAQEGRNPGFRPPYGLCVGDSPGTFAVVEAEAAVVRRIFALRDQGLGYRRIAEALSGAGLTFRGGRPWTGQAVAAVLRNPLYTGRLVYGRRSGRAPLTVEAPEIPRLVDPEQFRRVQPSGSPTRPGAPRAEGSPHLLTGLLRCLHCGAAMTARRKYGPGGRPYYMCTGQRSRGTAHCDCGFIRQEELDRCVLQGLLAQYRPDPGALRAEFPRLTAGVPADPWAPLSPAERKHVLRQLVAQLGVYRAPGSAEVRCELTWVRSG